MITNEITVNDDVHAVEGLEAQSIKKEVAGFGDGRWVLVIAGRDGGVCAWCGKFRLAIILHKYYLGAK